MLCDLSPHTTKADCAPKVFAGVLSPVNSSEAEKSHASFHSAHYLNAECVQTHFSSMLKHPSYPSPVYAPRHLAIKGEIN